MKSIKRLAVIAVAVLMILSLSVLVSCGGNTDESTSPSTDSQTTQSTNSNNPGSSTTDSSTNGGDNTDQDNPNLVTVKVVDQNGKAIKGAVVQICQGETCFFAPIVTGTDGVGSNEYSLNGERLKAKVNSIGGMDDYLAPGTSGYVYFNSGERELTITIKKVHIEVFDQDSKSIEAAKIKLYQGDEAFLEELITDADGIATGFIASNGEEISAVVTDILSGGNYKLSNERVPFGIGLYEGIITVSKLSAYTVKISTMLGENVKDAKVELYSVEKNIKQKTAYTDENGIVKFENVAPGEYYVKVSHENPSYFITTESVDGKYMFGSGTSLILEAITFSEIEYTVTLSDKASGVYVLLLNKNNEEIAFAFTDENGVAHLNAPNGDYVAVVVAEDGSYYSPVYFEYDKTANGTSTKGSTAAGSSRSTPILLYGSAIEYNFTAGEDVWFLVVNPAGKELTVLSESSFKMTFFTGAGGEISAQFTPNSYTYQADFDYVLIEAESEMAVSLTVTAPGTAGSPIDITDSASVDINTMEHTFESGASVYYTFTANEDTVICVKAEGLSILFNWEEGTYYDGSYIYPVKAGDSVVIIISSYEETVIDASVSYSLIEDCKIDYTITVYKEFALADGIVVILYKTTEDGGLVEVARGTTGENGEYVFESIPYTSDYVVKVEFPQGYTFSAEEEVYLGNSTYGYYYIELERTGSVELPFNYDIMTGEETAIVPENGMVWYTINVRYGKFAIAASSENAVIVVYLSDTNDDGIIDQNDEPVGVSTVKDGVAEYWFTTSEKNYKIAVMTMDGSAETIDLVYYQEQAAEGETPDTAIEIAESTTSTVTVNGVVYYRVTADECKLTITVSEGVVLQRVTFTMDGTPTIDNAENNTILIEDTMGDWIYFALSGEGEAELSVTIE